MLWFLIILKVTMCADQAKTTGTDSFVALYPQKSLQKSHNTSSFCKNKMSRGFRTLLGTHSPYLSIVIGNRNTELLFRKEYAHHTECRSTVLKELGMSLS